jgi:peptidoglycan/LPS O-acetylase OafA/YrhL
MLQWLARSFELQDRNHARLLPMEGLRGFAVTLVFLQHYATQALLLMQPAPVSGAVLQTLKNYGNLGVELFFVLSGFLIYGHLIQRRPSIGSFLARRAVRLYPAFLCAFALSVLLNFAGPANRIPARPLDATLYLLANLAFLPGLFPVQPLLTVAWSLSYEAFFYIAVALLVAGLGLDQRRRATRIALILAMAGLLTAAALFDLAGTPVRMLPFFAGMLLAEGVGTQRVRVPGWLGVVAPAVALLIGVTGLVPGVAREWVYTIAFFLLCAACFREQGIAVEIFSLAPLRWLGNMSYSYYLLHGTVVFFSAQILARTLGHGLSPTLFWILLPAAFIATWMPPALLFLLVEKPLSLRPTRVDRIGDGGQPMAQPRRV